MTDERFSLLEIDNNAAPVIATPAVVEPVDTAPAQPTAPPMTFPFAAPALPVIPTAKGMTTSHGVGMSDRMSRCYLWLRAEVAPGFDPFWTDSHVAQYAAKIDAAIVKAEELPAGVEFRDDLIADLRAVRSRTPEARVAATVLAADVAAATQHASEQLVAVAEGNESTGCVTYWSLSGDLALSSMTEFWKEQGLDPELLPTPPTETAAFSRACADEKSRRVLVRQHPDGGWQFVFEQATHSAPLAYNVGPRLVIDKDGAIKLHDDAGKDHPEAAALLERVRASFTEHRATVSAHDVGQWLVWICRKLDAVSLRATGGVYFIPKDHIEKFHAIKACVKSTSSHRIFEIPALKSADAVAAILDAIQEEVDALAEQVRGELQDGIGARKARNRIDSIDSLAEKIAGYERLLGKPMTGAQAVLKKLVEGLKLTTTRGSMLEVD